MLQAMQEASDMGFLENPYQTKMAVGQLYIPTAT